MKTAGFFLTILLLAPALQAQHVFHSLEEVWQYAEAHNITVASALNEQQVAEKNIRQVYGNLLPSASINGAFTDNVKIQPTLIPAELFGGEPGAYLEETFGKRYMYNANLSVQLDLVNTANWFAIKAAKYGHDMSTLSLEKSRHDLYNLTAQAYYSFQLMVETQTLVSESVASSRETWEHTLHRYNEGQVNETTLNTAAINLKKAELTLLTALQNQQYALNSLKELLNMAPEDSLILQSTILPAEKLDAPPLQASSAPEVKLAYTQMLAAKNNWQSARAMYAPSLSAVYSASTQVAGDEFMNFSNSNNLPQQYWGLRFTMPLLAHNTRSFQISKSKMEYELKEQQYNSMLKQVSVQDEDMITGFTDASTTLSRSREILELYQQNDQHAARQLNEGVISTDARLKVYQDYVAYQNEYLQHLSDYFVRYYQVQVRQKS